MLAGNEGHTIRDAAEALAFEAACRRHPRAWTPRDMDPAPVAVGETLLLEPCVGPEYERQHKGRRCPRVELWGENVDAARLVMAALPAHTRPLLPALVDSMTAELDADETRELLDRTFAVLQGEAVRDYFIDRAALPESEED